MELLATRRVNGDQCIGYENSGLGHEVRVKPKLEGPSLFRELRQYGKVPAGGLGRRFYLRLVAVADVYDQRRSFDGFPARWRSVGDPGAELLAGPG